MARKKNNPKSAGALEAVARLAHAHLGSRVVKDAYDASVERKRNAWKTKRTPAEAREANRASIRAWYVDQALQARRDRGIAAYEEACKEMVEKGMARPSPDERRAWSLREQVKVRVIVPTKSRRGHKFTDQKELRAAVKAELGFGKGISFREAVIGKEAAQLINRLRGVIDDVREFVRDDGATRRQQGPVDQGADLLAKWLADYEFFEKQNDVVRLPRVRLAGELARLVDWWTQHTDAEARPQNDREMAEMALRNGYWPLVDMKRHPTVANVIAQVQRGVRQIRNGH